MRSPWVNLQELLGLKISTEPLIPSVPMPTPQEHPTSVDIFSIVGRELHDLTRTIKAISIRVNDPSLNRDIAKYQLSHIWDKVLFNTPDLTLK